MVGSFFLALVAGIAPSMVWLWFWLREDEHHEPKSLVSAVFLGGIFAVVIAILGERYVATFIGDQTQLYIVWAAMEEFVKFMAVAIIILSSPKAFREPIDAMMYCIVVALGFAALENALFILTPISQGEIAKSIVTGNMRFMGATLVHIVSTALVGFAIGLTYYRRFAAKFFAAIVGLILATALHAAFNLSIINADPTSTLKTFAWFWLAVVILIMLFEEVKVVKPRQT